MPLLLLAAVEAASLLFATSLGTLTIAGISLGGPLGGLLLTGAALGLSYALNRTKRPGAPSAANSPEIRANVRQAVPGKRVPYGRVRTGGPIFFLDDSKPPYLYLGTMLADRQINRVLSANVGGHDIFFSGIDALDSVYNGKIFASFRTGSASQVIDALLAADFTNLAATFRQRGIATAVFKFAYGADADEFETLWGRVQIPNALCDLEGALVFDPRDPTQSQADPTTWKYTRNAALIQADWCVYGKGLDPALADWDRIAEAADYDDELVARLDGTFEKRHSIDGVVSLEQDPDEVLEAMLTANNGAFVQNLHQWWIESSKPRDAVTTLTDNDICGPLEFRARRPRRDLVNKVKTRFSAADREWAEAEGPVLDRQDLAGEDAETLESSIRLPFTSSASAVQRLAKQFLDTSRLDKTLSMPVRLWKGLGLQAGHCVRVYSRLYPEMNGLYLVAKKGFAEDFSAVSLQLAEYDPTIATDWDPSVDEQDFALPELTVS